MTLFSRDALNEAAALVHQTVPPTPSFAWPLLAKRIGATVVVKHENHTPTGAFKVRGGLVYMDRLKHAHGGRLKGVISATRGNHGQSIAVGAAKVGVAATIVVPQGNSVERTRPCALLAPSWSRPATTSTPRARLPCVWPSNAG